MVRLLRRELKSNEQVRERFQSHNGAIAACLGRKRQETEENVSIPQWCDCCLLRVSYLTISVSMGFQYHNGAIAAAVYFYEE